MGKNPAVYVHGEVTGLYPDLTVVTETSESPYVCCGYCAAHMACLTAKAGLSKLMQKEAHAIRKAGGRPHNNGARASELRAGASKALGVTLKSVAKADIPSRVQKGYAVVVSLDYAKLPAWLKVQGGTFGHNVTLFGYRKDSKGEVFVGYFDPLWKQGARGAWVKWSALKPALWADGNHSTTTVKVVPVAGDYVIYDESVASIKRGKIAGSTAFFNDWRMTQKRGTFGSAGGTVQIMGYRGDAYAVRVKTAQGWDDGISRVTLVFVPKTSLSGIEDIPLPPPGPTAEQVLEIRKQEYDRVMGVFPPRPA